MSQTPYSPCPLHTALIGTRSAAVAFLANQSCELELLDILALREVFQLLLSLWLLVPGFYRISAGTTRVTVLWLINELSTTPNTKTKLDTRNKSLIVCDLAVTA